MSPTPPNDPPPGTQRRSDAIRYTPADVPLIEPGDEAFMRRRTSLAGAGRRVVAWAIDLIITGLPPLLVLLLASPDPVPTGRECSTRLRIFECTTVDHDQLMRVRAFALVVHLVLAVVVIVAPMGTSGRSPGLAAMNLRVVDTENDGPIGVPRALLRYLGSMVSAAFCFAGYAWAAFSDHQQTLHDLAASSIVVRPPR